MTGRPPGRRTAKTNRERRSELLSDCPVTGKQRMRQLGQAALTLNLGGTARYFCSPQALGEQFYLRS